MNIGNHGQDVGSLCCSLEVSVQPGSVSWWQLARQHLLSDAIFEWWDPTSAPTEGTDLGPITKDIEPPTVINPASIKVVLLGQRLNCRDAGVSDLAQIRSSTLGFL